MTTLTTIAATGALRLSWLLLAFPLFGAAVLLLGGRRTDRWGHLLGAAMPVASFVYAVIAFFTLLGAGGAGDISRRLLVPGPGFDPRSRSARGSGRAASGGTDEISPIRVSTVAGGETNGDVL